MRIVAVGRMGDGPESRMFGRYAGRMRPALGLSEVADGVGVGAERRRREAVGLLAAMPERGFVVALDQGGEAVGSEGLARLIGRWREAGRAPHFLIGGAEGLDATVLARAGFALSLGAMTWPHLLARVMLAEQLYRACSILDGHPYHRAGRPG